MRFNAIKLLEKIAKIDSSSGIKTEKDLNLVSNPDEKQLETILKATSDLRLKIGESLKTDNVVFVLANGCSLYAGSKSTIGKADIANEEKYSLIAGDLTNALAGDVETRLNSFNVLKEYYALTSNSEKLSLINELISEVKQDLLDNYVCGLDYSKLVYHEMFLLKLRSFGVLNKTSIFTPNYDLAFEYSFDKLKEEYSSGFTGFINRRFSISSFDKYQPNIVKIHGSLNWRFDQESQEIKEYQPVFKGNFVDSCQIGDAIIYPTSEKLFQTYNTPYSELLRFMLDRLQVNKNVVFVMGYKYGDEHINDVLLKSLSNPLNIYFFFDYDESNNCEFLKQIKQIEQSVQNINIISGKFLADFTNFVKYLLPSNSEKTDEEIIVELLRKVIK